MCCTEAIDNGFIDPNAEVAAGGTEGVLAPGSRIRLLIE